MTTTDTPTLSREARRLIAHCSATGDFVADSRAAVVCDVPLRNLVHTLEHAVEAGQLVRVRHPSGVMGYRAPNDEASETPDGDQQPAAPQADRSREKAGRFSALPDLDLSAITVKMAPKFDGRSHAQKSKWTVLFDKLAERDVEGDNLPTIELPPEYGGAIGAAAPDWNRARKDGKRIRVSRNKSVTVVQIEMAKAGGAA